MSMDGSFNLSMELQRVISRCPKLGAVSGFTALIQKGDELKEEEVVNALAGVFLHPSYTIPILGCFRPIAEKIVERVVELLKLVPELKFDHGKRVMNSGEDRVFVRCDEFDDIESVGVVDVYARSGRFLDLHELACFAFCRALDLAPFLKGSVDYYYEFGGPPFVRVLDMGSVSKMASEMAGHLRDVVWTSYRILLLDPEHFSSRWNWCCFLELLNQSESFDSSFDIRVDREIRWCGVQILCALLRLPSRIVDSFGIQQTEVLTCLLRWSEFRWDVSVERAGWYTTRKESSGSAHANNGEDFMAVDALKLLDCEQPKRCGPRYMGDCDPFLLTSSTNRSYERVVLAVNQRWPILLYGPPGSGKTALINKLAHERGNQVLSIHLDDQIDGRTLVGSYVCTERPGEFKWQPGPLTQAVKNGFWVVLENIDQAASDVQSILLPLLEGGSSLMTGHGEAIRVASGFRLFSTISTSKVDICHRFEGRTTLSALWRWVMITSATNSDLMRIVTAWYPDLEPIAGNLIDTFERLGGTSESIPSRNANPISRFSSRDLLKWCKRISGSGFRFDANGLSADMRYRIYQEAVDIFAACASSPANRLSIVKNIAKWWAVNVPESETLYSLNKPVLQDFPGAVQIGRVTLERGENASNLEKRPFVQIRSSFHVLERIACSVKWNEPVLLVGETGTGKTTLVQNLASRLGQRLTVLNLSQQSDVADLLGGFKPMDPHYICLPLYKEFEKLFSEIFSLKENDAFLARLKKLVSDKNWTMLLTGFQKGVRKVIEIGKCSPGTKRKRPLAKDVLRRWENYAQKVEAANRQIAASSGMIFSFVEGVFVTALRNGEWILLDEVNLAPPETLQRIIGVLDGEKGSLCLAENGVLVDRHPNFRIFACMNPATDAGKRDLPYSLRSRFTEYFVDDVLEDEDLILFVNEFLGDIRTEKDLVNRIVRFYKVAKKESEERLQDGANQKPQYSLRSLYRALEYIKKARNFGFQRALYDGFCMFFMTLLDERSAELMNQNIVSCLLGGDKKLPPPIPLDRLLNIKERPGSEQFLRDYVITKSVEEHIRTLARAAFIKRYPVLLQGPTSSGKTSLVQYLAAKTGHEFVRINNHEHTDLQEYLGSYITDATGRLVFHEGALVKAVRSGHWIVLDELNLAPSDVLEALNRLLDDNRELFVPELRETVRAHPNFMLFATQNPPTFYGGRKMLSRAFRNRFVEIHVDEIPDHELTEILERKCQIPRSYAKKMIEVMKELQLRRQNSKVFAGKHGFITPRDLFRWANRFRKDGRSYEDLAKDGYYLLAERLRNDNEKNIVQEVLEKHLRVRLKNDELYKQGSDQMDFFPENLGNIVWTKSMQRLYFLIEWCYQLKEPILLVGETGGGKTTVCQLLSMALNAKLHILNCHQYTETSDFIGGFYPVRERSRIASDFKDLIDKLLSTRAIVCFPEDIKISSDISKAPSTLKQLAEVLDSYKQRLSPLSDVTAEDLAAFEKVKEDLYLLYQKWQTIFIWQDGPLVKAMKNGDLLLVDEISLADDSVLERLNSVLEPDRKLSLAEKGGPDLEIIRAHDDFFLLATMNPGGDYGKKELSPALRNRFTEIWVPSVGDLIELKGIAKRLLVPELHCFVDPIVNFWEWFNQLQTGRILTVRDLLAWLDFVTKTYKSLQPNFAFLHGAFLVLLDGISLGTVLSKNEAAELRERCLGFLLKQLKENNSTVADSELFKMENYGWADVSRTDISELDGMECDNLFGIPPFYIEKGNERLKDEGFEFLAPTTRRNVLRVLRAMQLPKPVLLEGSPGVGKTSLVAAIGKYSGHKVVRINLSEQTDIMDLLGSDLPVESEEGLQFAWSDGILLQALREGSWVLLDEINLAQQSVLEGLNAILDHRAEVFIPELGQSFKCPSSFRVFACQNPTHQGGGRKGLPKSFLNRFTKVYVDELGEEDYLFICGSLFPAIPKPTLTKLIIFNKRLYEETMIYHKFAQEGSPWEFNLRDVIRSCEIIQGSLGKLNCDGFLNIVYVQRMRTAADRREVLRLYEDVFGTKPSINPYPRVQLDRHYLRVGDAFIKRNNFQSIKTIGNELKILPGMRNTLEAAAQCIQQQWLCILVGPTSSGKTSLIRLLAHLTGNVLHEINLSSATDISELLGSFEQYNAYRNFCSIASQLECYINEYCGLQLDSCANEFLRERKPLITKWLSFSSNVSFGNSAGSGSQDGESWRASLSLLVEVVELLQSDLERHSTLSVSWSLEDLSKLLKRIHKLQESQIGGSAPVKFEWVSGLLIKAVEKGEWIVLEDANLCNPTVLDRINSLAESNGSITVNECGNVDGRPLVLSPHPNFRMFLTVNPNQGNVSRAMRNRGIEIVVMQPYWLLDDDDEKIQEFELDDVKSFLTLSGIPGSLLVDSMAKAHMHARKEGRCLDVHITYLELGRWVHLFQQLLMTGNDVLWSLHKSWEHSYLSSLGESTGSDIVNEAKALYLSNVDPFGRRVAVSGDVKDEEKDIEELSLCLPGGWPAPLQLGDLARHSKEACVKQSCMYLEFLGAKCASFGLNNPKSRYLKESVNSHSSKSIYLLDMRMLHAMMYPKSLNDDKMSYVAPRESDHVLASKKLSFAVDWIIEQATEESDLELYLLWFSWFDSQVQPYCNFFGSFTGLLKEELTHPIWKCIFQIRHEVMSNQVVDIALKSVPMLALESADLLESMSISSAKRLCNAINCIGLLRRSLWQWNSEAIKQQRGGDECLGSVMRALRRLEEEVLNVIVESPSFDMLYQIYTDLLEEHILFWKVASSSKIENLLVHWASLIKIVSKLRGFFQEAVDSLLRNLQVMSMNMRNRLHYSLSSEKSLLWAHGGHPSLPHCADIFHKLQQLVGFAKLVWPRKMVLQKQVDQQLVEIAVSTNAELRFLAMQGVCMASSMMGKLNEVESIGQKLQEMYEVLLGRFESEKNELEASNAPPTKGYGLAKSACCKIAAEVMCQRSVFESLMENRPLVDDTSLWLDLFLLEDISSAATVADSQHLQTVLSGLCHDIRYSLDFSLNFSSRPPLDFVPHQELLWTVDAWTSSHAACSKVLVSVLEMWFNWHSSLWNFPVNKKDPQVTHTNDFLLPEMLVRPVKTNTVQQILRTAFVMKDYHAHCFELRVASSNLWRSIVPNVDLSSPLLCAARSLLLQIISAHRKSFTPDEFAAINSCFVSLLSNEVKHEDIKALLSLLASSRHQRFVSIIEPFIKPLLEDVFSIHSSSESSYRASCAWLRLGGLQFHLLLACGGLDPAVKYNSKHTKLMEKCQSLALENEVRQHCNYLIGSLQSRKSDEQRARLLQKLELDSKRLQRKIVYRSDPGKFIKLMDECNEFSENVNLGLKLLNATELSSNLPSLIMQASNWQATATRFIDRLSEEYSGYVDIIQPIQVAIYEMKLGMALLLSTSMQKEFLDRIQEEAGPVLDAIYSCMRFPRGYSCETPVHVNYGSPEFPFYSIAFPECKSVKKMELLKKLIPAGEGLNGTKEASSIRLEASLFENALEHLTDLVANTKLLTNASFTVLDMVFAFFTSSWKDVKVDEETKRDSEAQAYKFRPRVFKLEDVCEVDLSSLNNSFSGESFTEWKELLHDEESIQRQKEDANQADSSGDWNVIPESILNNMVNVHNQFFGSRNFVENPGVVHVSGPDRLHSFVKSYNLGATIIKDMTGLSASLLDARLVTEHMLRLCVEHEQKLLSPYKPGGVRNFYKDANPSVVASMVQSLMVLRQKVVSLLEVRDEHPGLLKILEIIEMLLALPESTSVAQALSGLQYLMNKIRIEQENGAKFPLNDELEPILAAVSSFQKMEYETWNNMLDDVVVQFEMNAAKLWFPLYLVLHRGNATDAAEYAQSTLQSLEDLIRTSNVGEFRRRLLLMLSFYGQLDAGIRLGNYASSFSKETRDILYNVFGFYVQFLPIITEHIESTTKSIRKEMGEFLKLCQWERPERLVSMENAKRNRLKLKKLVQKYTDALQQPVMLVLTQQSAQKSLKLEKPSDKSANTEEISAFDISQFSDVKRASWYGNWLKKVDDAMKNLHLERREAQAPLCNTNVDEGSKQNHCLKSPCSAYPEEWSEVWHQVEKICRAVVETADIWKAEGKSQVKTRAFSDLLKLLENSGLSKHRTTLLKLLESNSLFNSKPALLDDELKTSQSSWWFLLPSYDVHHLLLKHEDPSLRKANQTAFNFKISSGASLEDKWKFANQHYFKSLSSVRHLQQVSLNFHKDFTTDQANRSNSFLEHLVMIQMEQRAAAYGFNKLLKHLAERIGCLRKLYLTSGSPVQASSAEGIASPSIHHLLSCMWQQKEFVDTLCILLDEESLMLKTLQNTHLTTCQSVKPAANEILALIEHFNPLFKNSKALLDAELLGDCGSTIKVAASIPAVVMSKDMIQLVAQNFRLIRELQERLVALNEKRVNKRSVEGILLGHFEEITRKAREMEEKFHSSNQSKTPMLTENVSGVQTELCAYVSDAFKRINDALVKLGSWSNRSLSDDVSLEKITSWKLMFSSYAEDLQLDLVCKELDKIIYFARELASTCVSNETNVQFKSLEELLSGLLAFGDGLVGDFLAIHELVSILTNRLAEIFASWFTEGYGVPTEEVDDDSGATQDAKGTGMGEGAGVKDVSDQITDEDQLLGTSGEREEQDTTDQVPSKNDKGIEMEQDFEADAYSVSEDSEDDKDDDNGDDDEAEKLDSAMGNTGDDGEAVDEKLWDKEQDENLDGGNEKNEASGPSVKDRDPDNRELKAKDDADADVDADADAKTDELAEGNADESKDDEMDAGDDALDDDKENNTEDMNVDKDRAFPDNSGLDLNEPNQILEDAEDMEVEPTEDPMDDGDEAEEKDDEMNGDAADDDNKVGPEDEIMEKGELDQVGERAEKGDDDSEKMDDENGNMDLTAPSKNIYEPGNTDSADNNQFPNTETTQAMNNNEKQEANNSVSAAREMQWSMNNDDAQNDLSSSQNASQIEVMMGDSSKGKLTNEPTKSHLPQQDFSSFQKNQPNPLRDIGDALEDWKERVKVSADLPETNKDDAVDEMVDNEEEANEYGFTSEHEKGTAQALGSALPDQIDHNMMPTEKPNDDGVTANEENPSEDFQKEEDGPEAAVNHSVLMSKMEEKRTKINDSHDETMHVEEVVEAQSKYNPGAGGQLESVVSLKPYIASEDINQTSNELSNGGDELGKVQNLVQQFNDMQTSAAALWRKYELRTSRLSQELAEQLRLVMEPTLASKLQGDYRTGKRINLKKVPPYIISGYQKDKIWLRRTKPNKRDYQVVIVVDDSRSMSENCCGDFATEALVTVCRALSQLEVGKLAVASFGRQGNIKLLHDFEQPLTGEAGMKMISSLTFNQENTLREEPMVDLLKYLSNMLDQAVANARLPSGQNPLQQLVLIIADGRFHDNKEKLKRSIRDVLNRNCMVAFLVLDSGQESIVDCKDYIFKNGVLEKAAPYLDSFPFPYYIVLRNIEALPRTLADLLRQWFELMQNNRD